MKLATFDAGNGPRLGAVTPGGMVDLTATGDPILTSMRALIEAAKVNKTVGDISIQSYKLKKKFKAISSRCFK